MLREILKVSQDFLELVKRFRFSIHVTEDVAIIPRKILNVLRIRFSCYDFIKSPIENQQKSGSPFCKT